MTHRADAPMDPARRDQATAARGFMPPDEGDALFDAGCEATRSVPDAPLIEIGTYCGKSSIWLGSAAEAAGTVLYTVDHHRGSEENQPGWEHHEPDLVDPEIGLMDTLGIFRRTIAHAGLEQSVIAVVGDSPVVAAHWATPVALLFIDGGHGSEPAHTDYEMWTPKVAPGGLLCIHDVFENPAEGGRPPYEIYQRALASERFVDERAVGSLRVLRRVS